MRLKTTLAAIVALLAASIGLFTVNSSPASAAVGCAGHATVPDLLVLHDSNGVPTGREALSIATQTCTSTEPDRVDSLLEVPSLRGHRLV